MNFKKIFKSAKNFFWISILFFGLFFLFPLNSFAWNDDSEEKDRWYLPMWWSTQIDSQLDLTRSDFTKEDDDWDDYKKFDSNWNEKLDWFEQLEYYLTSGFIPLLKFIMVWVAIIFLIVGLFSIIFSIWAESETEAKNFWTKFWFAILWFVLISFSEKIAEAVNPLVWDNASDFWDIWKFESMANILVNFSAILIWWIAVAVIVISWIKILQSRWEWVEDEFKRILSAWAWLIITLLSRKFIYEIFFTNYWMSWVNETASLSTTQEVMWVVSFFMQYIAIWWVALIVLAWIYYMFSSWEGNDNTALAKWIIKNVSIWLVILMSSYSLVTIFLPV